MQTSPLDFHLSPMTSSAIDRLAAMTGTTTEAHRTASTVQIDLTVQMEPLEHVWRQLEADPLNSLHQSYDWCSAWHKTHRNPLAILHGTQNGRSVFILPLEITRHNMIRTAQFIGARFNNINTGLFDAEFRAHCDKADADHIAASIVSLLHGRADLVHLTNIPLEWRGERNPLATLPAVENQNHAFQLPLFSDFSATIAQLNGKRRQKKFRSQNRKLETTGGYEYYIARSDEEKSALLDLFLEQKATRFKANGIPNVFQPAETQAFFRILLESGRDGQDTPLELHAIRLKGELDGAIPAIAGMSRKGDHAICQFGSIDATLHADASPGELLFWLIIEKYCAEGAALFDFGLGDQEYKRRWCTIETIQHDILLPISAPGRLAAIAQRGVTRTKAVIKGNPQLYALIQRLRAQADSVEKPKAPAD